MVPGNPGKSTEVTMFKCYFPYLFSGVGVSFDKCIIITLTDKYIGFCPTAGKTCLQSLQLLHGAQTEDTVAIQLGKQVDFVHQYARH